MFKIKIIYIPGNRGFILHGCHSGEKNSGHCRAGYRCKSAGRERCLDTVQNDYVGVVEESISIPLSFLTSGTIEQVIGRRRDACEKRTVACIAEQ